MYSIKSCSRADSSVVLLAYCKTGKLQNMKMWCFMNHVCYGIAQPKRQVHSLQLIRIDDIFSSADIEFSAAHNVFACEKIKTWSPTSQKAWSSKHFLSWGGLQMFHLSRSPLNNDM